MNNVNTVQNPRTRRHDDRKVLGVAFSVSAPNAASWRAYLSSLAVGCGLNEIAPLANSSGTSHPLPSGRQRRREYSFHRLATGGYGDGWLRRQVVLGA